MKEHFQKYWAGYLGVLLFFALLFGLINEDRKQKLMQHSKITFGFLIEEDHSSLNFQHGTFKFQVNGKIQVFDYSGDFSYLSKGDTVLIEYAIEDPTVAKVKDRYYMQKYRHLR